MADIVVGGHEGGPGGAPPKPGRRQNEAVPLCDKVSRATWPLTSGCYNDTQQFTRCDFGVCHGQPTRSGGGSNAQSMASRREAAAVTPQAAHLGGAVGLGG